MEKKGRIECEVSGRWLQFPKASHKTPNMNYIVLDVMTIGESDKERKLCELIFDRQQLEKILAELPTNENT